MEFFRGKEDRLVAKKKVQKVKNPLCHNGMRQLPPGN